MEKNEKYVVVTGNSITGTHCLGIFDDMYSALFEFQDSVSTFLEKRLFHKMDITDLSFDEIIEAGANSDEFIEILSRKPPPL